MRENWKKKGHSDSYSYNLSSPNPPAVKCQTLNSFELNVEIPAFGVEVIGFVSKLQFVTLYYHYTQPQYLRPQTQICHSLNLHLESLSHKDLSLLNWRVCHLLRHQFDFDFFLKKMMFHFVCYYYLNSESNFIYSFLLQKDLDWYLPRSHLQTDHL